MRNGSFCQCTYEFVEQEDDTEYLETLIIHKVLLQQTCCHTVAARAASLVSCSDPFAWFLPCLLLASWGWCPEWEPGAKCSSLYVINGVSGWTAWDGCTTGTLLDCGEKYNKNYMKERWHYTWASSALFHALYSPVPCHMIRGLVRHI